MGKVTGFLEFRRKDDAVIPPEERIRSFAEFRDPMDEKERIRQAGRCMNCGVPFCQSAMKLSGMVVGCPLHNLIPEWNDQIWLRHPGHGFDRLQKTSSFPEFTGRVCPALCEKACTCGEHTDPVSVHENEKYLVEWAFAHGYIRPRIPKIRSGKRVAVVGSGPSGLAVADWLNRRGHSVCVYEREDRIGGLLMYGIPNMKLDKEIVFRRQRLMEQEGVEFRTGTDIRGREAADRLLQEYDAVVLCCGAKQARPLAGADPEKISGVYYAVDFLKSTTKSLLKSGDLSAEALLRTGGFPSAKNKHVVVVGGGDTGNDCIGTVIRHGCKSVTALEMMPEPPEERLPSNPWPEWPKTKRTDYGHEEAIALWGRDPRVYETTVKELITGKNGKLKSIVTVQVKMEQGRPVPQEGTEKTLKCDLLLIAAGFPGCEAYTPEAFGTVLTARNTVQTPEGQYGTSVPGVFSAGDMHRGQSLVVWAIAEGRACAKEVDEYLMGYTV